MPLLLFGLSACSNKETLHSSVIQPNCGTDSALAGCLSPKFSPEYYIGQGVKYFRTMQTGFPDSIQPNYADLVIRWEHPPWLLLTGYTKAGLVATDNFLKLNPTAYDTIDCRYFAQQPFCRCHVIFNYSGEQCPIYEEFTFNDQGQTTFIEAWSDFPSLLPMGPGNDHVWQEEEYWGEKEVKRLSAKVPGLGNTQGHIDPRASYFKNSAKSDPELGDLLKRIQDPIPTYLQQLILHAKELKDGCKAPSGDSYPYYH